MYSTGEIKPHGTQHVQTNTDETLPRPAADIRLELLLLGQEIYTVTLRITSNTN